MASNKAAADSDQAGWRCERPLRSRVLGMVGFSHLAVLIAVVLLAGSRLRPDAVEATVIVLVLGYVLNDATASIRVADGTLRWRNPLRWYRLDARDVQRVEYVAQMRYRFSSRMTRPGLVVVRGHGLRPLPLYPVAWQSTDELRANAALLNRALANARKRRS